MISVKYSTTPSTDVVMKTSMFSMVPCYCSALSLRSLHITARRFCINDNSTYILPNHILAVDDSQHFFHIAFFLVNCHYAFPSSTIIIHLPFIWNQIIVLGPMAYDGTIEMLLHLCLLIRGNIRFCSEVLSVKRLNIDVLSFGVFFEQFT